MVQLKDLFRSEGFTNLNKSIAQLTAYNCFLCYTTSGEQSSVTWQC